MTPLRGFLAILLLAGPLAVAVAHPGISPGGDRVRIGAFAIDRAEVTIAQFRRYLAKASRETAAEKAGGGFEFDGGWQRRRGWTWSSPYGQPGSDSEPVVHVSWSEARDFCAAAGGRLPSQAEWRLAAYSESRDLPTDGLIKGRTYIYPVGDTPEGMNVSSRRHRPVASTQRGVNSLYDMGGNVWEWLADRRGDDALTAGGSWWYGAAQTQAAGMQWKAADFYAVYIGFRCAYDGD